MEGYGESVKLYEGALDSAGIAHQKFELYQDGVAAKTDKLKASLEGLSQQLLNSKEITGFIVSLTALTEALGNADSKINKVGQSVLFSIPIIQESAAMFWLLKEALIGVAEEESLENKAKSRAETVFNSISTESELIERLTSRYEELNKIKESGNGKFTSSETEKEYLDISNQLARLLPNLVEGYDETGQAVLKHTSLLKEELKVANDIYQNEKQRRADSAVKDYEEKSKAIEKQKLLVKELVDKLNEAKTAGDFNASEVLNIEISEANSQLFKLKDDLSQSVKDFQIIQRDLSGIKLGDEYQKIVDDVVSSIDFTGTSFEDQKKKFEQINNFIRSIQNALANPDKEQGAVMLESLENGLTDLLNQFEVSPSKIQPFIDAVTKQNTNLNGLAQSTGNATSAQEKHKETMNGLLGDIKSLNDLLQDSAKGKQISAEQAIELMSKEEDLANAFTFEGDVIKLNEDAVIKYRNAKIEAMTAMMNVQQVGVTKEAEALTQTLRGYGVQIEGIQSLADAKTALYEIDNNLNESKSIAEAMAWEKAKSQANKIIEAFNRVQNLIGTKAKSITSDNKDKSSSSSYKPMTEDAKELLRIETEITRLQTERAGLLTYSQKYRDNIEKEKEQLKQKIALLTKEFELTSKTKVVNGKISSNKYPAKLSDDAFKKSEELRKEVEKLQADLNSLTFDQINSKIEEYSNKLGSLDEEMKNVQFQLDTQIKGSKEYLQAEQRQIEIIEEKKKALHSYNESLREQLKLEGLTDVQKNELNKKIKENSKAWTEANNDIKASNYLKEQSDITDTLTDKLDTFNTLLSNTRTDSEEYNGLLVARNGLERNIIGSLENEINKREELIRKGGLSQDKVKELRGEIDQLQSKKVNIEVQISQRTSKSFTQINNEKFMEWADELANNFDHKKNRIIDELNELKDAAESVFADIEQGFKDITDDPIFNLNEATGNYTPIPTYDIETADSYAEALELINRHGQDYKEVAEQTNEIIKDHSLNDEKLEENIRREIKNRNTILEKIEKEKSLLKQKEMIYKQQEAMLEREISLLEQRNQLLLEGINKKIQVDSSEIDWEAIADQGYDAYGDKKITLNGKRIDLGDSATSIGEVSTDPRKFFNDVNKTNKEIDGNDKKADKIGTDLQRQVELEYQIGKAKADQFEKEKQLAELKKQGKEETKEYKQLETDIANGKTDIANKEKELAELQKGNVKNQKDLQEIIEDETETLNELKNKQKEINEEIRNRKAFYKIEEDALRNQIDLIEEARSKMMDGLKSKMEDKYSTVFDLSKFADELNALPSSEKINLDANINIGDVSTNVSSIYSEIVGYNNQLLGLNKDNSVIQADINKKLTEQKEKQNKINELALQGKENTEEYKKLKTELATIDTDIEALQKKMNGNIEDQIALNDQLIELERKIADEIRDKNIVFEQQKDAINDAIEQKQKEIELLDEQYEREDRLLKLQELRDEIAKVKSDKRFEYINAQGQVELTYDKAKVAELEKQLSDTEKEYARDDAKKAKQKEIDQLQENLKELQEKHDKEIAILQAYLNNVSEFRGKLENNINKSIDQLDGLYQKEIKNKNDYLTNLQTSHGKVIAQLEYQATVYGELIKKQEAKINEHITNLEKAFALEVEQKEKELNEMKEIHEADLEAHRNYISSMEGLVDKLNNNIASKIDALATSLQGIIDKVRSGDWFGIDASMNPSSGESAGSDVPDHMQTDKSNYTPPPKEDKRGRKEKYHVGGSVSNPNPTGLAAFANNLLNKNLSSDEVEIIAQKNEIMSPVKNFTKNLLPNMRRFVDYAITPFTQSQSISKDTHYHITVEKVVANNPMEFLKGIPNHIRANQV